MLHEALVRGVAADADEPGPFSQNPQAAALLVAPFSGSPPKATSKEDKETLGVTEEII